MKKKLGWKKNIGITAIFLVAIILFNQIPASAGVVDNVQNSIALIIGHADDLPASSFEKSSTNGKLNQMKTAVDTVNASIDQMVSPYIGNLTVWVDNENTTYSGLQVSIKDSNGKIKTSSYVAKNDHYEADFGNILKGNYTISYPYIISGKIANLSVSTTLSAGSNRKQLFGDLFRMSMSDVQAVCRAGAISEIAHVGDTISDGTFTYTIIGINQDKPSDADGNLLPESSYGDVLTLMPLGASLGASNGQPVVTNANATPWGTTTDVMNDKFTNRGGWELSKMRSAIMPQYFNKLPQSTQNVIGYVQKITGTYDYNNINNGGKNSVTGDKCFLLSSKEISGGSGNGNESWCTKEEANATFHYQYFQSIATSEESRNINKQWWLRSPRYSQNNLFCGVNLGDASFEAGAAYKHCVFAVFCIY